MKNIMKILSAGLIVATLGLSGSNAYAHGPDGDAGPMQMRHNHMMQAKGPMMGNGMMSRGMMQRKMMGRNMMGRGMMHQGMMGNGMMGRGMMQRGMMHQGMMGIRS